jgi:hypothetical protein
MLGDRGTPLILSFPKLKEVRILLDMFTKKEWHYGGSGGVELNGKRAYFPEVDEELLRSKIGMYISRIQIFSSRTCDTFIEGFNNDIIQALTTTICGDVKRKSQSSWNFKARSIGDPFSGISLQLFTQNGVRNTFLRKNGTSRRFLRKFITRDQVDSTSKERVCILVCN